MTVLHVREEALREALISFPAVRDLRTSAEGAHSLRIEVIEHDQLAQLESNGRRVALSTSGKPLQGVPVRTGLPLIDVSAAADEASATEDRHTAVAILNSAPVALRKRVDRVMPDGLGWRLDMRRGPQLLIGPPVELAAKWAATARVLVDRGAAGAAYVDVRLPERPVAGTRQLPATEPVAPAPIPASIPQP